MPREKRVRHSLISSLSAACSSRARRARSMLTVSFATIVDLRNGLPDRRAARRAGRRNRRAVHVRSEEHTSELQSLMRISYAVFILKKYIPYFTNPIPTYFFLKQNITIYYTISTTSS